MPSSLLNTPNKLNDCVCNVSVAYNTTSTYGRFIRTTPNLQVDNQLISKFKSKYLELTKALHNTTIPVSDKEINESFFAEIEESFYSCLSSDGSFEMFSDTPDHLGKPMGRYILRDKDNKYNYIIDVFINLDVQLVISPIKRFFLANVFRKWAKVDASQMFPRLLYRVKIWNTPVSHYLLTLMERPLDVTYTHSVEHARDLVGYPKIYDPKDRSMYERIDYDIRRAIFNEIAPVVPKGSSRANLGISGRDDS